MGTHAGPIFPWFQPRKSPREALRPRLTPSTNALHSMLVNALHSMLASCSETMLTPCRPSVRRTSMCACMCRPSPLNVAQSPGSMDVVHHRMLLWLTLHRCPVSCTAREDRLCSGSYFEEAAGTIGLESLTGSVVSAVCVVSRYGTTCILISYMLHCQVYGWATR